MLLKKNEGKKVGDRDANGDPRARVFESEREEAGVHLTVTVEDKGGGGGGGEGGGRRATSQHPRSSVLACGPEAYRQRRRRRPPAADIPDGQPGPNRRSL
ncbi:hypothetical protein RB195_000084 [Necator americanus]|uniref:Uncharacterized protein n=1 Tax=Necator americanus TaxID=51031 RepID=A0ABR1D8H4_NECAM